MGSIAYQPNENWDRMNWGAIWAGLFTFTAIWAVFGSLGFAIFASAATPQAAHPVSGMSWGIGIWSVVLTGIAMWVAGAATIRLARPASRGHKMVYANTMFGLAVAAVVILTAVAGATLAGGTGVNANPTGRYTLNIVSGLGWGGFISLLVGWLCAMGGAASVTESRRAERNVTPMRPAA